MLYTVKEFSDEQERRKLKIIRTVLLNFIVLFFFALFSSVVYTITIYNTGSVPLFEDIIVIVVEIFVIFFLLLSYKLTNRKISANAYIFLIIPNLLLVPITVVLFGPFTAYTYLITILLTATTGILYNYKVGLYFFLFSILSILLLGPATYDNQTFTGSSVENTINLFVHIYLMFIIYRVISISYGQVGSSYAQAYSYAKELEALNKQLDKRVRSRSKRLEDNFQKQVDSLHALAIVGGVTKSMLHDLKSPLSSLKGFFEMVFPRNNGETIEIGVDSEELFELAFAAATAVEQIDRIMQSSKEIMDGKQKRDIFEPKFILMRSIEAAKNLFQKNDIQVNIDEIVETQLYGNLGLYERVILNILLNSAEELIEHKGPEDEKKIEVRSFINSNNKLEVRIRDNGRGIDKYTKKKIFDKSFSSKKQQSNYGFGLKFVKSTLENEFNGRIEVDSVLGSYSEFIIITPIHIDEKKKTSSNKAPAKKLLTKQESNN